MELQEGFEAYGKFWIDTHNHYSDGFLYVKDGKIELILCNSSGNPIILDYKTSLMYGWTNQGFLILSELYATGSFGGVSTSCFHGFKKYEEIHIWKYKFTISKCFFIENKYAWRFLKNSSSKSFDHATGLSKDKILKSNNLTFYINHSDKWMSIDIARESPIRSNENREIDHYEIYGIKNLYIKLDNQVELKIVIEKLIQGKIRFELMNNSDNPNINKLIELSKKITYLLQFSLFSKVGMYGVNTSINRTDIKIYDSYIPDYVENVDSARILLDVDRINQLECDVENMLNSWISKFDLFETPLQLYLKKDSVHRFFDLYRCLEKLASELGYVKHGKYGDEVYKKMIKEFAEYSINILDITRKEHKDKYEEIVKRIKEIRDCLAHGWRKFEDKEPINNMDAQNERFYNYLMEFIFQSIVLRELGFSNDNIKAITSNNYLKYQIHTVEVNEPPAVQVYDSQS